jgi:hypothetical protein
MTLAEELKTIKGEYQKREGAVIDEIKEHLVWCNKNNYYETNYSLLDIANKMNYANLLADVPVHNVCYRVGQFFDKIINTLEQEGFQVEVTHVRGVSIATMKITWNK